MKAPALLTALLLACTLTAAQAQSAPPEKVLRISGIHRLTM